MTGSHMRNYFKCSGKKHFIKLLCFASAIHFFAGRLNAQITERIVIKAGEDISTAFSSHGMYRFAAFKPGLVKFKDGTFAKALLNYNVILNDMQFINTNGDTLVLTDINLVDSIRIDTNVFYYQKGYVQVMNDYNDNKLVMRQINSVQYLKKGALGLPNPTVHTFSYEQVPSESYLGTKLLINEDVVILKEISYFLVYKKFRQTPAVYDGFLKAFPELKREIQQYVNENKINFKMEADLNKLLKFCLQHVS